MRPYILAETNWNALKDASFEMAILPWGATEAHNYHLPYGTDILEADLIAAESARMAWEKGARPIVLPTIPFGVNTGQRDIYLDININPVTQLAILSDIIDVLNHQKIFKLMILNSHGGNDFKWMLRELGVKFPTDVSYAQPTGIRHWIKANILMFLAITPMKWKPAYCCICVPIWFCLRKNGVKAKRRKIQSVLLARVGPGPSESGQKLLLIPVSEIPWQPQQKKVKSFSGMLHWQSAV
jgi:hypothetical protein